MKYTKNKICKNLGILFQARDYLSKDGYYYYHYCTMPIFTHTQINILLCLYSHIYELCQFNMTRYDKNKPKENPQPVKARHLYLPFIKISFQTIQKFLYKTKLLIYINQIF